MATGVDHAHVLATQSPAQDGTVSLAKRRLVDVEFVGIDGALDDVFAQSVDARDEDHIAKTGFRIQRECDAAGGPVGSDHLHHADRKRDLEMVEPIVGAIGNCAVRENGSKAAPTGVEQIFHAVNVEETFVLAGKARRRQILGGGRAADGDRNVSAILVFERPIGSGNLLPQALGAGGLEDDLACFGSALCEDIHAGFIEPVQKLMQLVPCSGRSERVAVCLGRQGKTIRNSDALSRKNGIKLPERSVLAANDRNIAEMNIAEPTNISSGRPSC